MSSVLYKKDNFQFIKNEKNNYSLFFDMKNNNMILYKAVDFSMIKLIYDLNTDIYERVNINRINENEVTMNMLMKHLFEDLGLPQRFSYVHIKKQIYDDRIEFISQSIHSERPTDMPESAELMPIKKMIITSHIKNDHECLFDCNVQFEDNMNVPPFAEKMVGLILYKIFNRVKQFIENINI